MPNPNPTFDWLSELPMPMGEPFLRMGTRGIDSSEWLRVDDQTDHELMLRADLLAEHPDYAQFLPGNDDALAELVGLVEAHRGETLKDGPVVRGVRTDLAGLAVTIAEDVLVMVRNDQHWFLAGGVLLFPDQWRMTDKIGKSIADIHGPTDGYDELLEAKVDQFFDRLKAGRLVQRRNWFVHDEPRHFLDHRTSHRSFSDPAEAASLWIRSERQTLQRLERSDAIIFTVKTQFAPMTELAERPAVASKMAAFLGQAGDRLLDNKDVSGRTGALLSYLSAVGSSATQ